MTPRYKKLSAALLAVLLVLSGTSPAFARTTESATEEIRLQDDFYSAVNAQWLEEVTLAKDQVSVGGFHDLSREVNAKLMMDFDAMRAEETTGALREFLVYYAMAKDYVTRDAQGREPLMPYVRRIEALDSLAQLNEELEQWTLDNMPLPFSLYVSPDMGDARRHALYLAAPDLFLPDVSYYDEPSGRYLLAVLEQVGQTLLELAGIENAQEVTADALAFDAMLLPYAQSAEELSAYAALYNPVETDGFTACHADLDLGELIQSLLGQRPEEVIVINPPYFAAMGDIVTEEHFIKLKHWMLFNAVFNFSAYLDQSALYTAAVYQMALTGQEIPQNPKELAYIMSTNVYGGVVGDYYGRRYFGDAARDEVSAMTREIIRSFTELLRENDWLSPQTIAAALSKLEALTVNIGYPDALDPIYSRFVVSDTEAGGTLLGNTMAFARVAREENFAQFGQEVDRSAWSMTAHTVNAQYNPMLNAITFPAAILQAPFYSLEQSESANYGGIGAIIAHEITHAFDANGAQFDESGSLLNWWTEADYQAFTEKTQAMVALFDGLIYEGGSVNGQMTVAENMADAGGLRCALQVVSALPDGNLEEFFRNWAAIWRMKATQAYTRLLLALDVHAPNQLRANVQLANLDDFYDVFSVTEEDGMYIPPERRVRIW